MLEAPIRNQTTRALFAVPMALLVPVLFVACDDDDIGSVTFAVNQDVSEQTITGDAGLAGNPLSTSVTTTMPDITNEPEYQAEVFDVVDAVVIDEITLTIDPTSPYPDFSFVDSISIWAGPVGGGVGTQRVAFLDPGDPQLTPAGNTLQLHTTGVNLIDLIDNGDYELRVDADGTIPPDDVIFVGDVVIDVTVKIF